MDWTIRKINFRWICMTFWKGDLNETCKGCWFILNGFVHHWNFYRVLNRICDCWWHPRNRYWWNTWNRYRSGLYRWWFHSWTYVANGYGYIGGGSGRYSFNNVVMERTPLVVVSLKVKQGAVDGFGFSIWIRYTQLIVRGNPWYWYLVI